MLSLFCNPLLLNKIDARQPRKDQNLRDLRVFRKNKLKQSKDGLSLCHWVGTNRGQCFSPAGQWLEIPIPGCLRKWDPDILRRQEKEEKRKHLGGLLYKEQKNTKTSKCASTFRMNYLRIIFLWNQATRGKERMGCKDEGKQGERHFYPCYTIAAVLLSHGWRKFQVISKTLVHRRLRTANTPIFWHPSPSC